MKQSMRLYFWIFGVAAVVAVLGIAYFRAGKAPLRPGTGKLTVAGTIYPLYDMARNVAGDHASVRLIVPPGGSPHLFEFSPRQLKDLQNVRAVFAIGHGLDNWAAQITNAVRGARVIVVDRGIRLRTFADGTTDPHYWLDIGNAEKITDNIAAALSEMDPAHAQAYRRNAQAYKAKLTQKELELKTVLAPVQGKPILTFHDAWYYFAEDFGLKIAGTFEPAAAQEPTPRYLARLQRTIREGHIRVIFIEPQLSTAILKSFARDNNITIAELDPLGGVEGRTTYLELMEFNANSIRQAFRTQSS